MADKFTKEQRSACMAKVCSTNTTPEIKVRQCLWRLGFRYRTNAHDLPGSPDIVLPKYRTAILVHGCFWHGHEGCRNYRIPKTNTDYWISKVIHNKERDQEVWRQLEAKGWSVIIVWECELEKKRFDDTIDRVAKEIKENGELYAQRKEERKLLRLQRLAEIREQKERQAALMSEIQCVR